MSMQCTCPGGDGSLRWPCPVHPPLPSRPIPHPSCRCAPLERIKPHLRRTRGLWYCEGPRDPSSRIVYHVGTIDPCDAFREYVARSQFRAGLPMDIAS